MLGLRLFFIGIVAFCALVAIGLYVFKLQKDNAILKANVKKWKVQYLNKRINRKSKKDFQEILNANKEMNELSK